MDKSTLSLERKAELLRLPDLEALDQLREDIEHDPDYTYEQKADLDRLLGEVVVALQPRFVECETCNGSGQQMTQATWVKTGEIGGHTKTDFVTCPDCVSGLVGQHGWELESRCVVHGAPAVTSPPTECALFAAYLESYNEAPSCVFVLVERGPIPMGVEAQTDRSVPQGPIGEPEHKCPALAGNPCEICDPHDHGLDRWG